MTFVHGPEGLTLPEDKPAKLRFFLGYVDILAPAGDQGSDQARFSGVLHCARLIQPAFLPPCLCREP